MAMAIHVNALVEGGDPLNTVKILKAFDSKAFSDFNSKQGAPR